MAADSPNALLEEISRINWWHRIDLGHGVITPGSVDTLRLVGRLGLPSSLAGKTVLDIGAWDGFYSFDAEQRGATRVLATDSHSWNGEGWGSKAGFDLARRVLGSRVEDRGIDVLDLAPETVGTFDVVLFLGVLYHMKHPLLALERVHSVTGQMAVIETHVVFRHRAPMLEFYPDAELNGDPTNWFSPNPSALEAMLLAVGFTRVVKIFSGPNLGWRLLRALQHAALRRKPFTHALYHGRMVYHAYR